MFINDIEALLKANSIIEQLLDNGDNAGAIGFADTLRAGPGQESHVRNLRAYTYAHIGEQNKQIDKLEKAIRIWRSAGEDITTLDSYNLADSLLAIWNIHERRHGFSSSWLEKRDYLHESRKIFTDISTDEKAESELRLKALTNAGNSYDNVGRHTDAMDCYERAVAIDSSFAMATGNRGLALLYASPYMSDFEREVKLLAAAELEDAISNSESVLQHGGESALESFRQHRSSIRDVPNTSAAPASTPPSFTDPHMDWCLREGLFLHASPELMGSSTSILDPLFFRQITTGVNASGIALTNEIIDAFNTIKQDFVSARYMVWASSEHSSPIRVHAQSITSHVSFLDTLQYGRWGVRTGIAIQAFKAGVYVLDKIASFTHLYFDTKQPAKSVSFRNLPYEDGKKRQLAGAFLKALQGKKLNRGLAALIDLSYDLDSKLSLPLYRNVKVRNAATNRLVTVHSESAPTSSKWSERVNWRELIEEALFQLRLARSAIFYLAQMIDTQEDVSAATGSGTSVTMPLPYYRLDTDLLEAD